MVGPVPVFWAMQLASIPTEAIEANSRIILPLHQVIGITSNGLMLGNVRHERRAFPLGAIIGLAPILMNPLGLLFVTALLTPLTFQEVANPSVRVVAEGIFASELLSDSPNHRRISFARIRVCSKIVR